MLRSLTGHLWTVGGKLRHALAPHHAPPPRPWHAALEDPDVGPLRLTGSLHAVEDARAAVVIVHGLGGSPESYYCLRAAGAVTRAGLSALRLALRGADRLGEDISHAGLTADIHAALRSEALARFERLYVLGYSLGGHTALRLAAEELDPRVRAVAAVCAPLDLAAAQRHIDRAANAGYRRYLMSGLKDIYARVAARRPMPIDPRHARRILTFEEWDTRVVAPRFGFADAQDYYARVTAIDALDRLRVPTLFVGADHDPIVHAATVRPALARPRPMLEVRWTERGGHVGFPARVDLGMGPPRDLEEAVIEWLEEQGRESG